jgi:hypothetical protein
VPRYFFHLYDDVCARDEEGRLLPDADAAKMAAVASARDLICEQVRNGYFDRRHRIEVEDGREIVLTVRFGDAVSVSG